jgi:hypothetical protein
MVLGQHGEYCCVCAKQVDDDEPHHFRSINDILRTVGFAPHAPVAEELHVMSSDELTSFTEAEGSPIWRKVMIKEMMFIKEKGTPRLIDLPLHHKLIKVMWVFNLK